MRRLSLHIGAHKTGTTSLQVTLQQNEDLLRARGLGLSSAAPAPHVHKYLGFHNPDTFLPLGFCVRDPQGFAAFLADHPADHVFASSENFSFIFQQSVLHDLATALRQKFARIDILVYLRRQDRHAVSHHQEGAKPHRHPEAALWGHGLNALPEPSDLQRLYLDYDARLMLWENAFGRESLRVRVFDRAVLRDNDIVSDALDLIGIDPHGLRRAGDRNVSLSHLQAVIGHLANDAVADDVVTARLLEAFPWHNSKILPTQAAARAFLAPYVESNRRLNTRLQISANPDLFGEDFADYPTESTEALAQDDWANALRVVVATLAKGAGAVADVTADDLRDAAVALEKTQPQTALRLIRAAQELRPNGGQIYKIKTELEARLRGTAPPYP
jgi:hypothetical protein